ncbi:hypothetical protein GBZ26_10795 [Azospirillum formosense]|uniref:Uncharacterized protein n=1 Tax=Azospirillum formosense TaxID=861533 RepID=A0ABX2KZQ0_9PROT|nr:hypothetical protein [Azospirillum formosense]
MRACPHARASPPSPRADDGDHLCGLLVQCGRLEEGCAPVERPIAWEDRWSADPRCRTAGRFPQPMGGGRLLVRGQGTGNEPMFATLPHVLTQSSTHEAQSSTQASPAGRGLVGRDDSPWYPSAHRFRPTAAGNRRAPPDAVANRPRALFP